MNDHEITARLVELSTANGFPIGEDIVRKAVSFSQVREFAKGEIIKSMGDGSKESAIVLRGIVRSYYIDSDGNDMTRSFSMECGWCLDEGMIGYTQHHCMWEALEDSILLLFDAEEMKAMIYDNEELNSSFCLSESDSLNKSSFLSARAFSFWYSGVAEMLIS